MNQLVSIIIPTYNRRGLINETLDSVLAQTYANWECIVVDDGSNDNTSEIVQYYTKKDHRFKFFNRPKNRKKGASACRNYGYEKSKGRYIQFLDSDDILDASKLFNQVEILNQQPALSIATCKWGYFSDSSSLMARFKHQFYSYRSFNNSIDLLNTFGYYNEFSPPHVYLAPRKLIEKSGLWNEELSNNDDTEFFTRIIINANRIIFCNNTAVYYRISGDNQLSTINSEERMLSAIRSWKLVISHIKEKAMGNNNYYFKNGIYFLYHQNKLKFPDIIQEHRNFFQNRRDYNSRYYKIFKKLKA